LKNKIGIKVDSVELANEPFDRIYYYYRSAQDSAFIGMQGTGKSFVYKLLASILNIDADHFFGVKLWILRLAM